MQDPFKVVFSDELKAVDLALAALKVKLAQAPDDDWRSSIAWEAVQAAQEALHAGMWDAYCIPSLRRDWRHWRDQYDLPWTRVPRRH